MRTKKQALWPKPPWCISQVLPKPRKGPPWSFVVDGILPFLGAYFVFCHFDFPVPDPLPPDPTYEVFAAGVLASTGLYPASAPGTTVAFLWFTDPIPVTGNLVW